MIWPDLLIAGVAVLCTMAATFILLGTGSKPTTTEPEPAPESVSFLFEDGVLHHATRAANGLFPAEERPRYWSEMRQALLDRFPDFPELPIQSEEGEITLHASDPNSRQEAQIAWRDNLCWLTLHKDDYQLPAETLAELKALRLACSTTPYPAWIEDPEGEVVWQNDEYQKLATELDTNKPFGAPHKNGVERIRLREDDCFEVTSSTSGEVTVNHAICVKAVVAAEEAQHNFIQTLTKIFAHLSTGLAIFDKNGQLALFNPALVDLTGLKADFLSARPTMLSFFDALRENRHMPEPKNYTSWRQEITEMINAAADGSYHETWSLESGQTFSVSGRPHPDGATAFLIEDISAEVTVTRNFRAELEQTHGLIDAMDEAMAVFSTGGVLTLCNVAYRKLWGMDPDASFADIKIADCAKVWTEGAAGTKWQTVEDYVTGAINVPPPELPFALSDGVARVCTVEGMATGTTLVRFSAQRSQSRAKKAAKVQAG